MTTIQELERVHLRFISVKDDARLTDILSKILPNMINVFFDKDLQNQTLEHEKVKALNQILEHLQMRVQNSQAVIPPWSSLIDLLNQEIFYSFHNVQIREHALTQLFNFIFMSFSRLTETSDQTFLHALLLTLENEKLKLQLKGKLYMILLHRLTDYFRSNDLAKLVQILQPIWTESLKKTFLQMSLYYLVNRVHPQGVQQNLGISFRQELMDLTERFRDTLKETQTQFEQNYEEVILRLVSNQLLFTVEDHVPLQLIASLSSINKTRDQAEINLRSIISTLDTRTNVVTPERIYKILFNEAYFFVDFPDRDDENLQPMNYVFQIKIIDWLLKFESSANLQPYNQRLIYDCLFQGIQSLEKTGLNFIVHMIKFSDLQQPSIVNFLRSTLNKIIQDGNYMPESIAQSLKMIADIGLKNYAAINDDIEIAITLFQRLRDRVNDLELDGILGIRSDMEALCYIEALNKLRECYQQNLKDTNKRNMLESYVLNYLNKEGMKCNSEITYLLYLYLSRLDKGQMNSSVLLYSILLKDHDDIKIKREALQQLETFTVESEKQDSKLILRSFLKDVEAYLHRNNMNFVEGGRDDKVFEDFLSFNNQQFQKNFIEKLEELSQFAVKFFKNELSIEEDQKMDLEDGQEIQEKLERLLTMNLNQNYSTIKSDFSRALDLIQEYLNLKPAIGVLQTIALNLIYKISQNSSHLHQRVISLKIIIRILKSNPTAQSTFINEVAQSINLKDKTIQSLNHEAKLNLLFQSTLILTQKHQLIDSNKWNDVVLTFNELSESILFNANLSPNIIELIKFQVVCLRKIGQKLDLQKEIIGEEKLEKIIQQLLSQIKRSEIDLAFRKFVLQNYAGILKKADKEYLMIKQKELQEALIQQDNFDLQEQNSKALAKMNYYISEEQLISYSQQLAEKVFAKMDETITLNLKRNSAISLYAVVDEYGKKSQALKDKFQIFQRVFLKFLFDRKAYMQDISSKALSMIYNMGSPEARKQLVESLSKTLAGEKDTLEHKEKDENNELLLEFKDNTSTEQREKLKTYKDLCNIADELGHRELIYQFLESHRHLSQYEDIKNAAKGLNRIIMLDEQLRADLLKIAPKILLLSYDHNQGVQQTMKDLWSSIVEVEKEEQIINDRWNEIFEEAVRGLSHKEYRRRQSSCLSLSDLLSKREWAQVKAKFRDLFLQTFALLDDDKDTVKKAAFQLVQTLKRFTLKFGNIYTNSNVDELEEILSIVFPMILNETMKSTIKGVSMISIDLLFDLLKTTQNQGMMQKLKIQNKYERQLVFNYNSELKMREILNKFLDKIILEVIANISLMNKGDEYLNYLEQYAAMQGMMSTSSNRNKYGITEQEINEYKVKYTKDSSRGEILKICRDQMTADTFDKIVNQLITFIRTGHDNLTKSTAIEFIKDIILENKLTLISPQNSRKISQKLVEIYTMNSVNTVLGIKDSIKLLYAQLLGLQFKILKEFPNTVKQVIESVLALPKELEYIICLNVYEISKNLPEEMIKTDSGKIFKQAIPMMYINRYKLEDHAIKTLCRKSYQYIQDHVSQLTEANQEEIFAMVREWLNSSQYDDRVSASLAMQDLVVKLSEDDIRNSNTVNDLMVQLQEIIAGKHFNQKEIIIDGYLALLKLNRRYLQDEAYINKQVEICINQIIKYSDSKPQYKNKVIFQLIQILGLSNMILSQHKVKIFEIMFDELKIALRKISDKASLIDTSDEFEEKKEEEKLIQQTASLSFETLPSVCQAKQEVEQICDLSLSFYNKTNWMVRNSIVKASVQLLKNAKEDIREVMISFSHSLIVLIAEVGEKYDSNLGLISELILSFTEKQRQHEQSIIESILTILELIQQKGQESLKKNNDLIKRNIGL